MAASSSAGPVDPAGRVVAKSALPGNLVNNVTERLRESSAAEGVVLSTMAEDIQRLKEEQKRLRETKKQVQKELRNAQRRKSRLCKRARELSNEDLVAVLLQREAAPTPRTTEVAPTGPAPTVAATSTEGQAPDDASSPIY